MLAWIKIGFGVLTCCSLLLILIGYRDLGVIWCVIVATSWTITNIIRDALYALTTILKRSTDAKTIKR